MDCPHVKSLRIPPTNALIYKDECTQCFDNTDDPLGLDVCLTCYNGACTGDLNHSAFHAQLSGHPCVLNLRRIKLPPKDECEEKPAKITKLAIGVAGGAFAGEKEEFETISTVKCLACGGVELDKTAGMMPEIVDNIIMRMSVHRQEELKEWVDVRTECEHALLLAQDENIPSLSDKGLAHCGECDIKENFWLCLTCGHLGCGRRQYDGTGGNNHAFEHYEKTKHPVVVKTGTIQSDGTADVNCYLCDEMRLDPGLPQHLKGLGIEIGLLEKTAKSMAEIELDQNLELKLETARDGEKKLVPVYGPGHTGIENLGSTCYMSAVLQVVMALPEFKDKSVARVHGPLVPCRLMRECQCRYLPMGIGHLMDCRADHATCWHCQVTKLAQGLWSGRYSQAPQTLDNGEMGPAPRGIPPRMFRSLVNRNHAEFMSSRQQDSHEFLHHLMDVVTRSERAFHSNPCDTFEFNMQQRLECMKCHGVRYSTIRHSDVTVPIPVESGKEKDTVPLEACFKQFAAPEVFDDFHCPKCESKQSVIKTNAMETFPKTMVVQLRRFVYDNWVPSKLDTPVMIPDVLDLTDLSAKQPPADEILLQMDDIEMESVPAGPAYDAAILDQLMAMGFPRVRCEKALVATGDNMEMAMDWIMSHMDDPNIDVPAPTPASKPAPPVVDEEQAQQLSAMGFDVKLARKALRETAGNMERALDWVFSHADDPNALKDDEPVTESKSEDKAVNVVGKPLSECAPRYRLVSSIVHLGSGVHAGHYVAYVSDDEGAVYFNDTKAARADEPHHELAYLLFFRRVDE